MNKFNKKGFTLIEMLVVIAIIAVLVSIIIPTVTSATDKAAAATNAANLRSIKAEVITAVLTNDNTVYTITKDATTGKVTAVTTSKTLPEAKKCGDCPATANIYVDVNSTTNDVTVYFGDGTNYYSIKNFADFAEGKALATSTATAPALLKSGT